jgi:hypothetical protein
MSDTPLPASDALSDLFNVGTGFWNFMPRVTVQIFDGGCNRANLQVSELDRYMALAQYEKSIQSTLREVAAALAATASRCTGYWAAWAMPVPCNEVDHHREMWPKAADGFNRR